MVALYQKGKVGDWVIRWVFNLAASPVIGKEKGS